MGAHSRARKIGFLSDIVQTQNARSKTSRFGLINACCFHFTVQIPASLQSDELEVTDPDVIETICYGLLLDNPLAEQFEESQSPDGVSSAFTYFGSWTGVMRIFPGATYGISCGDYDPRIRPW